MFDAGQVGEDSPTPPPLPPPLPPFHSLSFSLQVANMLRTLTHGRAADDDSDLGPTQAMYSTILVILQASIGVQSVGYDILPLYIGT